MRRSRIQVKPNIGLKSRPEKTKPSVTESEDKVVSTKTICPKADQKPEDKSYNARDETDTISTVKSKEKTSAIGSFCLFSALNKEDELLPQRKNDEEQFSNGENQKVQDTNEFTQCLSHEAKKKDVPAEKQSTGSRRKFLPKVKPNVPPGRAKDRKPEEKDDAARKVEEKKTDTNFDPKSPKPRLDEPPSKPSITKISTKDGLPEKDKVNSEEKNTKPVKNDVKKSVPDDDGKKHPNLVSAKRSTETRKPARVKRKVIFVDAPFDRTKITMKDLIYLNPIANPMKRTYLIKDKNASYSKPVQAMVVSEKPEIENSKPAKPSVPDQPVEKLHKDVPDCDHGDADDEDDDDDNMLAPQVKIGPDGNIILNEETLTVEAAQEKSTIDETNSEVVYEEESYTTYTSFRNKKRAKQWTQKETAKFYTALRAVGSDFAMMANFFPRRNRLELKNKFKKEEKINRELVDRAMTEPIKFDLSLFSMMSSESEGEQEKVKKRKTSSTDKENVKEKIPKKRMKKQKANKNLELLSDSEENNSETVKSKKEIKPKKKSPKKSDKQVAESAETNNVGSGNETVDRDKPLDKENPQGEDLSQCQIEDNQSDDIDQAMEVDSVSELGAPPIGTSESEDSDINEEEVVMNHLRTTRSGRQSKPTKPFSLSNLLSRTKKESDTSKDSNKKPITTRKRTSKHSKPNLSRKRNLSGKNKKTKIGDTAEVISVSDLNNVDMNEIQPGQLVFVGGQKSEDSDVQQVIHVYMVSPSGDGGENDLQVAIQKAVDEQGNVYHINLDNCIEVETENEDEDGNVADENVIYLGNNRIVCSPQKAATPEVRVVQSDDGREKEEQEEEEGEEVEEEAEQDYVIEYNSDSDIINISDSD